MAIRGGKKGDEEIFANIHITSWKNAFTTFVTSEEMDVYTDAQRVIRIYETILNEKAVHSFLQEVNGKPHAIACWSKSRTQEKDSAAELICIHSLQDHWRQGYGTKLLKHVEEDMHQCGYREAVLWVFVHNHRARRFYEKNGWHAGVQTKHDFQTEEILYTKQLQ